MRITPTSAVLVLTIAALDLYAAGQAATRWVTCWSGSSHGPYPSGNASAQPDQRFAFPDPQAGARDQTFRLIVRPDTWGPTARLRLTNAFGARPLTIDDVHVALQLSGAATVPGTDAAVRFGGKVDVTIPPGGDRWSDPIGLTFISRDVSTLAGRKLAVSFHVVGTSGPMTWHAKALTTSYVTAPATGRHGADASEAAFPFSTTSWFFLDAIDMRLPAASRVIVAFGDSITDGTASTLNGDDRWPDVFSRQLHAVVGGIDSPSSMPASAVTGLRGRRISTAKPTSGGPSAEQRLTRDVISLSSVGAVIWLEGINDFARDQETPVEIVIATMRRVVGRLRAELPGAVIVGATLTSALNSTNAAHGSRDEDAKRQALNTFIRTSGVFDQVADFDAVTIDTATGELQVRFVPDSTTGGAGDRLHPNRAGYAAMARAVDVRWFTAPRR